MTRYNRSSKAGVMHQSTKAEGGSPAARAWAEHRMPTPQAREPKAAGGTTVCPVCLAFLREKRWHLGTGELREMEETSAFHTALCPSCAKLECGGYDAHMTLTSPVIARQREAIQNLIDHIEQDLHQDNPLVRVASVVGAGEVIEITTITTFIAERIGKELQKAYGGQLDVKKPHGKGVLRVSWHH